MTNRKETSGPSAAAKRALKQRFPGPTPNSQGYVRWPDENLVRGVKLDQFEADLRGGAGDELRIKFCAVHSSAALAVNSFARFKADASTLHILGRSGFSAPTFERQCPTELRRGTPPNLDVWLEAKGDVVAIESKLLEYLTPKKAKYSKAYQRKSFQHAEDCWWDVLENSKTAGKRNLDVAQLVKHYLGLIRHFEESEATSVTLLYLYWEPTNAGDLDVCRQHRRELAELAIQVESSNVGFKSMNYSQLWDEWDQITELREHVANLRERYEVDI
jgi:hypothetical protein